MAEIQQNPLTKETLFWISSQNRSLAAILHPASKEKLVILCHGLTGHKSDNARFFVEAARCFATSGLSALRFDYFGCGDSDGDFSEMTPNLKIQNLKDVIEWAQAHGYKKIGVLGMSMSGAVAISALHQLNPGTVQALVTWSSVPRFSDWLKDKGSSPLLPCWILGDAFYTDRPKVDLPQSYLELDLPKLHVQGTKDTEGYIDKFLEYFPKAKEPKKHHLIEGADHCFTQSKHRDEAIAITQDWFLKYLG